MFPSIASPLGQTQPNGSIGLGNGYRIAIGDGIASVAIRAPARSRCAIGSGLIRRTRNNRAVVLDSERELGAVQHIAGRRYCLLDGVGFAADKAFHLHRALQSLSGCRGVGPNILLRLSACATELARDLIRCVGNVYSTGALLVKENLDRRIPGNDHRTAIGDCPASRNRAHRFDGAGIGYLELPGGQLLVSRRRFCLFDAVGLTHNEQPACHEFGHIPIESNRFLGAAVAERALHLELGTGKWLAIFVLLIEDDARCIVFDQNVAHRAAGLDFPVPRCRFRHDTSSAIIADRDHDGSR